MYNAMTNCSFFDTDIFIQRSSEQIYRVCAT